MGFSVLRCVSASNGYWMRMYSVSEMEIEVHNEDTAASASATEIEDYPETDEPKNEQLTSRVRLPGGT